MRVPFVDKSGEIRTVQSEKHRSDINVIVENARRVGALPVSSRRGVFMDCTKIPDYQGMQDVFVRARAAFMELPAVVRDRFGNDPARLVEFLRDPQNIEEAIGLGLCVKPAPAPVATKPVVEPPKGKEHLPPGAPELRI